MTRTMYDSVDPFAIPTTASMVAGYVDGKFAWSQQGWNRFSGVKVRIAVFASTNDGIVLDVENGDATPAQAPGWVSMRRAAGADPTVYCTEATWPAVIAAFHAVRVTEPHYWIAAYPGGGPVIPNGAVAHQYINPPNSGGHWDLSVVSDYWPGVDIMTDPLNIAIPRQGTHFDGTPQTGNTTLGAATAWEDAHWDAVIGKLAANGNNISTLISLVNALTVQVAAIKAALPVTSLTGTATVTVNLAEGPPSA